MPAFFLLLLTFAEFVLLILILLFFRRLRRSEQMLETFQANQDDLLDRMLRNSALEQEMVATFAQRQEQLIALNRSMEERVQTLGKLVRHAEEIATSPYFLREVIIGGRKKGESVSYIAQKTGLAKDEIELILKKEGML